MMFGVRKHKQSSNFVTGGSRVAVHMDIRLENDAALQQRIADAISPWRVQPLGANVSRLPPVDAVFVLFGKIATLDRLAEDVRARRAMRDDGLPVLVVGVSPDQLTEFGGWLAAAAREDLVHGLRLIVDRDPHTVVERLAAHLEPVFEANIIAMPISTEVETQQFKYFFCLSPQLRQLLAHLADLATNNISRIYLLGGPGAGKTSLAYYFYLCRQQGNFVTVNLTAEATDDKAAMKSLLCGHVSGAFAGAGARSGAFSHAREGVCFLDESHGVSGSVMEVLMEALDSNQYLPYGASAKRPLECAIVFASNRNWETLIGAVNMDEHARLGAHILHLPDLAVRQEDLVAVLAATLHRMRARSTTWTAPAGLSDEAWQAVRDCAWRGNTRALIRVIETAYVTAASAGDPLIECDAIEDALALWEPRSHASHALYTRAGG